MSLSSRLHFLRLFLAVVGLSAICGSAAAQTAPQLTSISLTSPATLTAGNPVSFGFVITPGTTTTIDDIDVTFQDSSGHQINVQQTGLASGTVSGTSTTSWLNGSYTVILIQVQDTAGIRSVYYPNGTVSYPNGGTGPSTNAISFSALGFSLTGGVSSITAPQLTTISLSSSATLTAGNPLSFSFVITPGTTSTIEDIDVTFQDPSGHQYDVQQTGEVSGTVSGSSTASWLNGNYTITLIQIQDTAGIRTVYYPNGTVTYPLGGNGPSTHSIAFSTLGFSVTGGLNVAPTISSQPISQTVNSGSNATFTVTATGAPAPTYQWYFGSTSISGATSSSFTINSATSASAGSYSVVVSNSAGSVTSNLATLTVNPPATAPTITSQPQSQTIAAGFLTFLSVTATGSGTLSYQWYFDSAPISGATTFLYTIASSQPSNSGTYTVVVSNSSGSVTSVGAVVTVTGSSAGTVPTITTQPQSQTVPVGFLTFLSVTATGSGTLSYQWYKNGAPIAGATNFIYSIAASAQSDAATYTVIVTGSGGSVTSAPAIVTISSGPVPPSIISQPQSQTVPTGGGVTLSVSATGASSYQWELNGLPIAGATNATLALSDVGTDASGNYSVVITNSTGSVTSNSATIAVQTDARLANLSILSFVQGSLTMGFVVGGAGTTGPENLLIRSVGPSLNAFGVATLMPDPTLTVIQQSNQATSGSNSGWGTPATNAAAVIVADAATGAFPLSSNSLDAALVTSLPASNGGYSVVVAGKSGDSGNVLTEVYDAGVVPYSATTPRLVNLSCLTRLGVAGLDTGFVITGTSSETVLIRVSGPAVGAAPFNLVGTLPDPALSVSPLGNSAEILATNAGWGGNGTISSAAAKVGAFPWSNAASKDSAALVTLPPGGYTVQVSSLTGTTGTVLVEIYEVP